METKSAIVLIAASVILLFALPVLQILAFALLIFIIGTVVMTLIQDGDPLLMFYEQFGSSGSHLRGKVAWVTGASSGIGEALCYELAKKGVKLILSARRAKELLRVKERCVEEFGLRDDDVLVLPLDVLDYESHPGCAQKALDHFHKVDILVNNAGRSQRALAVDTSLEVDRALMDVDFIGQVSVTKAILPHMMSSNQGHIVNISSVTGKLPTEMSATYSASKHALHGYFGALAYENSALTVTNVCPGPIVSNIIENCFGNNLQQPKFKETTFKAERNSSMMMSTERCGFLIAVAIANNLSEVWICKGLVLLLMQMYQWCPLMTRWLKEKVYADKRIREFKKSQEQSLEG
ncbi:dehydrogenase/reductase SDR family member 7-like [Asterias rubens]|uniref:dehydrogenase/reductase SDR family member 7-like n=1 Tax=Asterias rubens TaxID=7604 RepID=UPI001455AF11|nr:dehydrogenase/reductase SDR family member 7-like [Asterias rubens]